jgi:hypothetical protein
MFELKFDRSGTLGRVESTCPERTEAGTILPWTVSFEAMQPIERGGRLALARRWPSDWGIPQASDPTAADYFTVSTAGGAPLRWWTEVVYPWHPFDHVLYVQTLAPLAAGERIELRFGDVASGSPGARTQTFIEEASPLSVRLQRAVDADWIEIARVEVEVEGTHAHAVVASAPSRVAVGEAFQIHLRVEDLWGNPAAGFEGEFVIEGADSPGGSVRSSQGSFSRVDAVLNEVGVHRLQVRQRDGDLAAITNPIMCDVDWGERLFWGDMHAQSLVGCGARSVSNYYRHARDFAGCDVGSHQANCYMVTAPEWQETESVTREMHEPGRFVPLLGVEWSALTPLGGDRNIYFPGDQAELRRCSHEFVADLSDLDTDLAHVGDLHAHYRDEDVVIALHVGGRTTNLRWQDLAVERLIEVHSTHATSEWFMLEALERGYKMGVIAGSDGVDGRPGASHPGHMSVRNVRGGLTAFAMPELTRDALWDAMRRRRCYATTGARILLDFECDGHPYGTEYDAAGPPTIRFRVEGTAPLDTVEIWRCTHKLYDVPLVASDPTPSNAIRVAWRGASGQGNWRQSRMVWDGQIRLDGARITNVSGYAFDSPDEGLGDWNDTVVNWRSITAGDWDGVVLELDQTDASAGRLDFATGPMTFTVPLDQIDERPFVVDAGNPSRTVRIQRLPAGLPSPSCLGSFVDPDPHPGCNAYWLRVLQHDGAQAWSSPVFATFPGDRKA